MFFQTPFAKPNSNISPLFSCISSKLALWLTLPSWSSTFIRLFYLQSVLISSSSPAIRILPLSLWEQDEILSELSCTQGFCLILIRMLVAQFNTDCVIRKQEETEHKRITMENCPHNGVMKHRDIHL